MLKIFLGLAGLAAAAWMWWGDVHLYVPRIYGTPIALACLVVSLFCGASQIKAAFKERDLSPGPERTGR
jgi:hypothetical protein